MLNFVDNGLDGAVALGSLGSTLMRNGFDVRALRPFVGKDGRSYVTVNQGGKLVSVPLMGNSATLRKDAWKTLDEAIVKIARQRLRAVSDLRQAGLQYSIANGMGKTVLETENSSDINEAVISMDPTRESQKDRPLFDITHLPLPVIHKDFSLNLRQLQASMDSGSPLDTTMAEQATRKVVEQAEQLLVGTAASFSYAGGTVYGYTNFPSRNTYDVTAPTEGGWTPATTVSDVLAMKLAAANDKHFGPFMLYCSLDWDRYMDDDYKNGSSSSSVTLRQRLRMIEGIQDVRTLDYLPTPYTLVLVQMSSDVARMVVGMDITTVQWESKGGLEQNFKVMCILVPQLRADQAGNCGIVHGAPA